jgi:hypothetical protein
MIALLVAPIDRQSGYGLKPVLSDDHPVLIRE